MAFHVIYSKIENSHNGLFHLFGMLPLGHTTSATLASLLFLEYTNPTPAARFICLFIFLSITYLILAVPFVWKSLSLRYPRGSLADMLQFLLLKYIISEAYPDCPIENYNSLLQHKILP